jgi:DNA-binding transcriptional ArsR family regulator
MADVSDLRAIAHPVRLRMLSLLTGTPMSAADLARELGITHANASYHLRQLADAGQVVVAGEQKIRGGVAKLYRYPHEADYEAGHPATPRNDPAGDHLLYAKALWAELERRLAERVEMPGGGFATDLDGWVSPDAWERAKELVREASKLLHDANRPPHTEDTVHVSFTGWVFRMAEQ